MTVLSRALEARYALNEIRETYGMQAEKRKPHLIYMSIRHIASDFD